MAQAYPGFLQGPDGQLHDPLELHTAILIAAAAKAGWPLTRDEVAAHRTRDCSCVGA